MFLFYSVICFVIYGLIAALAYKTRVKEVTFTPNHRTPPELDDLELLYWADSAVGEHEGDRTADIPFAQSWVVGCPHEIPGCDCPHCQPHMYSPRGCFYLGSTIPKFLTNQGSPQPHKCSTPLLYCPECD